MEKPKIRAIGLAVPQYSVTQSEVKEYIASLYCGQSLPLERFLKVFENGHIKKRHLAQPLSWYTVSHSFEEMNEVYRQTALDLGERAAVQAIEKAGISKEQIGMVVFNSTTGISTPSLEGEWILRLGLSLSTLRLPIWGLGCAGGAAGLARAAQLLSGMDKDKVILFITVELCSLTFQKQDVSKANLVGTSLFGDGAAAAIIGYEGTGPEILGFFSRMIPDSSDVMGWDVVDTGLKVRFSREIPAIVRQYLPGFLEEACSTWGIKKETLQHFVVHPGGAKVLQAYQASLKISLDSLKSAYAVLSQYGNMSSASLLFVLENFLEITPCAGAWGVMLALGPGFSAEQVFFRW